MQGLQNWIVLLATIEWKWRFRQTRMTFVDIWCEDYAHIVKTLPVFWRYRIRPLRICVVTGESSGFKCAIPLDVESFIWEIIIDKLTSFLHSDLSEVKVLVPGAGLGRLAWEIACLGYSCQGNEWSFFMLFSSNYVLNRYICFTKQGYFWEMETSKISPGIYWGDAGIEDGSGPDGPLFINLLHRWRWILDFDWSEFQIRQITDL